MSLSWLVRVINFHGVDSYASDDLEGPAAVNGCVSVRDELGRRVLREDERKLVDASAQVIARVTSASL